MEYDEAVRWLLTLPDFERTGAFADRPDIEPMRALLAALGEPQAGRPTVHIAGSKGKGSTGAMVEAVLRAAGLRTGYYISPHLHRFNERFRIDGQPAERKAFAAALTSAREPMARVEGRFPGREFIAFDALTAAGFVAFRDAAVDVQIVEVGLGGTLDSTNVFGGSSQLTVEGSRSESEEQTANSKEQRTQMDDDGAASGHRGVVINRGAHVVVLAPISLEHTEILGTTIAAIAGQKAGIITPGCVVVAAPQRESALDVFHAVSDERGATMVEVAKACQMARISATAEGQKFKLKTARATYEATLPLAGRHQLDNAATAVVACEELAARAGTELTAQQVRTGLSAVAWPARLEVLRRRPYVIVDGAHNGDSAKRMVAALREDFGLSRATFLFGTLAGKDVTSMREAVAPMADGVFVSGWLNKRAADVREVAEAFRASDAPVSAYGDLAQAFEAASAHAGERGALVAFGSLSFAAAVREYVLGIESDMIRLRAG